MTLIDVRDALVAWHLRRGCHKTGETQPFPYGDKCFGAPPRDDFIFVLLEKSPTPRRSMAKTAPIGGSPGKTASAASS